MQGDEVKIPQVVLAWLKQQGCGEKAFLQPVGGGCINNGARLRTQKGVTFFIKTNGRAPATMFACEAIGLQTLRSEDGPRVPEVLLHGPDFILMEDLAPALPRANYWIEFGQRLAALHQHVSPRYGFECDNFIGSTPQPNGWQTDGYAFFSEQRLLFQARLACQRKLLDHSALQKVGRLCTRLVELIPPQPASLLHGDLWSGNAVSDHHGAPAMVDPAAYYGWAEADLAMTTLFGSFPSAFYRAYEEVRPLVPGFWQRFPIYNLYHLLNHLNLFGAGYLGEVMETLDRFG